MWTVFPITVELLLQIVVSEISIYIFISETWVGTYTYACVYVCAQMHLLSCLAHIRCSIKHRCSISMIWTHTQCIMLLNCSEKSQILETRILLQLRYSLFVLLVQDLHFSDSLLPPLQNEGRTRKLLRSASSKILSLPSKYHFKSM